MPNSKQIVYLSQAQYAELIANGSITVDGVTVTYDENDIYVTPQAEPVTDVRVNGTSVSSGGVANVPIASTSDYGAVKIGNGVQIKSSLLSVLPSHATELKAGTQEYKPVAPSGQHISAFYGLAKVAGHDEASSTEPLGTYTPEAKGAIQKMLGVSDLIATEENNLIASKAYSIGEVFTANGKLYKATAAIAADAAIITDGANANCEETSVGEGFPHDVQVNSVSVLSNGVANIPIGSSSTFGVFKRGSGLYDSNGTLGVNSATDTDVKNGTLGVFATVSRQHISTFYGLAKAAGADEKDSTLPVGQYTDTAKAAICTMIGAVGNEDYASTSAAGVVKINTAYGIGMVQNALSTDQATVNMVKVGTDGFHAITPARQEQSVFYGLAKAAGDTTQAASDNVVGTYTDEAKSAIRTMLGAVGTEDYATASTAGIIKIDSPGSILEIDSNGVLKGRTATDTTIKLSTGTSQVLLPSQIHKITFYGLAKASGDTTQSSSSNAVGTYTDSAKASIKAMLGIQDGSTGTVDVSGATPTIAAVENTRYVCGEVTSLNFTPPASGISIVRFTSGSSVTVLTIPSTVKFPEWFDPTSLETNTIYEICVTDGEFGAVMSWAL